MTCVDPLECQPRVDGGVCVPAYVLNFTQPTPNQVFGGPDASVADFTVIMRRTDGGIPGHASIPFQIAGLTSPAPPTSLAVTGTPGQYRGSAALPLLTQTYVATGGWPGQAFANVTFNVDRLLPTVTLELGGPTRNYLRDEVVPVAIRSNKVLSTPSIVLSLTGTDGSAVLQGLTAPSVCTAAGLAMGIRDHCGLLNIWAPTMAGLNATFTASVAATDQVGNPGSFGLSIQVTRVRWRAAITGTPTVRAAPALDSQGNLFVGTQDSDITGRLVSFSPTGQTRFANSVGAVQSVSISATGTGNGAAEVAYFNVNGASLSNLTVMNTDGGPSSIIASSSCADTSRKTYSALALYDAGVNGGVVEVGALAVFNPSIATTVGGLCGFVPRTGATIANADVGLSMPEPENSFVLSPVNIVVTGNKGFVQRSDRQLNYIDFPVGNGGSSATYGQLSAVPLGLAVGQGALVSSWTGAASQSPVVTWQLPSAGSPIANTVPGWSTSRPVAILSGSVITATTEIGVSWLRSMTQSGTTLGAHANVSMPVAGNSGTTPVVGTGNRVYVVHRSGDLSVYDGSGATGVAGLSPVWSGPLFTSTANVVAHPTLDCSRNNGGLGTLYAVAIDGRITAVIVDSQKLETSAPWPKWQRTAGNAGNPGFPLNPGCP